MHDRFPTFPALAAALLWPGAAHAQLVTHLVNRDGVDIPCVTVGPLAPVAQEYCVKRSLDTGWTKRSDRGASGLTIGADGRVSAVAAGSPAERAGLRVGDQVTAIDRQPLPEPPATVARRLLFGKGGDKLKLALTRAGAPIERSYARAKLPEPADAPRSPNFLISLHPLQNWRGDYVPCMGAGPLGAIAVGACTSKMRKVGFVRTGELGGTGLTLNPARADAAVVQATAAPASDADVQPGDVLTAIDGHPLTSDPGTYAATLLFGKAGETRVVAVTRDGRAIDARLVLAAENAAPDPADKPQ